MMFLMQEFAKALTCLTWLNLRSQGLPTRHLPAVLRAVQLHQMRRHRHLRRHQMRCAALTRRSRSSLPSCAMLAERKACDASHPLPLCSLSCLGVPLMVLLGPHRLRCASCLMPRMLPQCRRRRLRRPRARLPRVPARVPARRRLPPLLPARATPAAPTRGPAQRASQSPPARHRHCWSPSSSPATTTRASPSRRPSSLPGGCYARI